MKRLLPVITILIFLSLLGIIFFQVLWILQATESRRQQFEQHVNVVISTAANELVQDRNNISPLNRKKNNEVLFPLNIYPPPVSKKFTREEIASRIKKVFQKNYIKTDPFQIRITNNYNEGKNN